MSHSVSDLLRMEGRGGVFRSACQNCCRRKDCPYSCDRAFERSLRLAAAQRKAAAQLLRAEAVRLLEEISRADNIGCLLSADEAAERALVRALDAETALMGGRFDA